MCHVNIDPGGRGFHFICRLVHHAAECGVILVNHATDEDRTVANISRVMRCAPLDATPTNSFLDVHKNVNKFCRRKVYVFVLKISRFWKCF